MSILLFFIFLITDLSMIGAFAFVYSGKERYEGGMILGVHIPTTEINHEDVLNQGKIYKKSLKKFNLWNLFLGTFICSLSFWNCTYFMIIWMIWLLGYLAWGMGLIYGSHRKLYDIKMKNNWIIEGNTHMIHIDTVLSSMSDKLPVSHWWSFGAVLFTGALLFLPQLKEYFGTNILQWILPGVVLFIAILFWGLHLWFSHRKNIVYSLDSSINLAMNRVEKRTWSVILLSANYLNLLSWSYLTIKIIINHWLYFSDYCIYIVLQNIPAFVIVIGFIYMQKKRKKVLAMDTAAIIVDDDEYWKNGWYNNPNDTNLLVQDRLCSTNYSMNMAKPAAKVISVVTAVLVTAITVGIFSVIFWFDNAEIVVKMDENQVTINAAIYNTDFNVSDIQSIKILQKMPEDDFTRTNGGATEKYLIGHFKGKETGKCMLYLYRDYVPILEIKLTDETIYLNSKNKNDVQGWYQKLID